MNTRTTDRAPRPLVDDARTPRKAPTLRVRAGVRAGNYEIIRECEHPWF